MTPLAASVGDYLVVRRALGYKLERAEKLLGQFVTYCDSVGVSVITTEVAVAWACLPADGSRWWWTQRLSVVRVFAKWLQAHEPATVVPPPDVFGRVEIPRAVPYLYTDAEVMALMDAAERLRYPLARVTYRTLIGLLAVTGMRVGEAIRLDCDDVDWDDRTLRVRSSKFDKSRLVVLHASAAAALKAYAVGRDELCPNPKAPALLLSGAGTRLIYCNVSSLFRKMAAIAGLPPRSGRCRPRIHDLRHAFAVRTITDWHAAGVDVEARLPSLSTYLGHADPKDSYWYLSATPELLALSVRRLDGLDIGGVR
ncbi:tyrosine-type recombinase/integrase [Acidiferrimicrobium sp. IK]|uniref:tyrosine-type recombinase/integrase n=1 Tax=Acidiferrimicrobium sp. IK TaxID=2871700 RepID=UPI0021CB8BC0|nr:tyrosine-type recombinase/integrase [Acidiferrimicrobium sp. IK]MCU4187393.1 tyrosine-type recombinase/integrase [Acidiferrimicrobium sp. IK]